jgi:plasmid stabilization system protein ParE
MEITFSIVAQEEYIEILYYLSDKFGDDMAIKFELDIVSNLEQLQKFPHSFAVFYETDKRKFMVTKNISVIYKINELTETIEILNFWFNRANPEVLLKHL